MAYREKICCAGTSQARLLPCFVSCILSFVALLSILAAGPALLQAQTPVQQFNIDDIVIEGNRRIDSAAIKSQLKAVFGRVSNELISEDIKTLYNTGFFDQVTASLVTSTSDPARQILKYTLAEKPVIRKIFIKGNKEIKEEDLSEAVKVGGSRFLDKAKLDTIIRNATTYYQSKGYYDAKFEHAVVPVGDNQVDLTLTVDEGERYKIDEISIQGLNQMDEDELLDAIQTREYKWWSSWLFSTGRLNKEMIENDKALMRQFFLDHGFVDASVGDPTIVKKDGLLDIVFHVNEGEQYNIGKITASGDLIEGSAERTLEGVKIESGDVFSATQIRDETFKISDKFTDVGYAFANVVPNTRVRRNEKLIDVEFTTNKGNIIQVNRINIRGNDKTYDNVIRRTLKIGEQERYSSSKIKRSQQLLERLGYFEEVNISSEPTEDPDEVDLLVNVREGSTGTFTAGAGYSSSDGAIFTTRVSENNLFGTGRSANITGEFGTERDNISVGFSDPRVADTYWSLGVQGYVTDREFSDFDRELSGGSVIVGYPLEEVFAEWAEDIAFSLKYEYTNIDISNVDIEDAAPLVIQSEGTSTASAITPAFVRNTINNPLNPTKGSRQVVSMELAGLGGSEEYYLFEARNQWYYPFAETEVGELVFSLRTTFGYGDSYDNDPFPLFRRYFPGGINSVRGYKSRSLGPEDEDGNEFGGSKELINNAEIIFPLINAAGIKGVIFYDVGEAFDDNETIDIGDLRQAYGFGIRWFSPLGPIRIEFGFPVDREEGEDSVVPMFSFGAPL
ncbi:MAG: outer membrane protein assembly factor BamA [Deltaproteobacteria bacterium]|nr:outer membrane protein assembly factor BamA [Deltaproteobacteria bacterium]